MKRRSRRETNHAERADTGHGDAQSERQPSRHNEVNRAWWNARVAHHIQSSYYGLQPFKSGKLSLRKLELTEVGDVAGARLLHLQCHFGLDTLSWARLGAQVTGVDFSEEAVTAARKLAAELSIPARFICSDIYELEGVLDETFDIVYCSYGVLCWLEDLALWGKTVARHLAPGGRAHLVEFHPLVAMLDKSLDKSMEEPRLSEPYFRHGEPILYRSADSYADRHAVFEEDETYTWPFPMSQVVGSLIEAGLRLDWLHEFPFCIEPVLPSMVEGHDGWYLPGHDLPFLFSLRATKP